jgi:hypothetical protein
MNPKLLTALAALLLLAGARSVCAGEVDEWRSCAATSARIERCSTSKSARARAAVEEALKLAAQGRGISHAAALAQAAHDVLVSLFPGQRESLDTKLALALVDVIDGPAKTAGILRGKSAAATALKKTGRSTVITKR